jgi:hypothetical protein
MAKLRDLAILLMPMVALAMLAGPSGPRFLLFNSHGLEPDKGPAG